MYTTAVFYPARFIHHLGKTSETAAANLLTPPLPGERPRSPCSIGGGNALPLKAPLLPLKLEAAAIVDVVLLLLLALLLVPTAPPSWIDEQRGGGEGRRKGQPTKTCGVLRSTHEHEHERINILENASTCCICKHHVPRQ